MPVPGVGKEPNQSFKAHRRLNFDTVCGQASRKILRKRTDDFNASIDHTVAEILGDERRDTGLADIRDEQRIPRRANLSAGPDTVKLND